MPDLPTENQVASSEFRLLRAPGSEDGPDMLLARNYLKTIHASLDEVWNSQQPQLSTAADWMAHTLAHQSFIYLFGTGHSHLLAEELFYRAGGLAQTAPILEEPLMLHKSASNSSEGERETGYAERILSRYPVTASDLLFIISNSGRNSVPVEMAGAARARGMRTIALTSLTHSQSVASRHSSGKRLFEVADLVIDNGAEVGDATTTVSGCPQKMGPTSTIVGAFLLNALCMEAAARAMEKGWTPAIYASANVDGAAHNEKLLARFKKHIRHL